MKIIFSFLQTGLFSVPKKTEKRCVAGDCGGLGYQKTSLLRTVPNTKRRRRGGSTPGSSLFCARHFLNCRRRRGPPAAASPTHFNLSSPLPPSFCNRPSLLQSKLDQICNTMKNGSPLPSFFAAKATFSRRIKVGKDPLYTLQRAVARSEGHCLLYKKEKQAPAGVKK